MGAPSFKDADNTGPNMRGKSENRDSATAVHLDRHQD